MVADERGVPRELTIARDFIQVRAALVRLLGANEALVWTRIDFRLQLDNPPYRDEDGVGWWPASRERIADETGLSPDQVKRALENLRQAGYIESVEHRLGGNYDRTKSYRSIVQDRPQDWADAPTETGRDRPHDGADAPTLPLIEELEKKEIQEEVHGHDRFDEFYSIWPRKVKRPDAQAAWTKAIKRTTPGTIIAAAIAYRDNPHVPPKTFIPYPASWLNADGWNDDLPEARTTDRPSGDAKAAAILNLGKQLQAQHDQKAIAS